MKKKTLNLLDYKKLTTQSSTSPKKKVHKATTQSSSHFSQPNRFFVFSLDEELNHNDFRFIGEKPESWRVNEDNDLLLLWSSRDALI